jgi:hypothetical protein
VKRCIILACLVVAGRLRAQEESKIQGEVRIDAFFADNSTVQGGGGGAWYLDRNIRLVLLGGAGSTFTNGIGEFSARADLLGRFVLDPDRTQKWALYGAGGLGVRYEAQPSWRGVLVALVGLEGPKWGAWTPFVEAGYGGGVQIGFGLRRARIHGR